MTAMLLASSILLNGCLVGTLRTRTDCSENSADPFGGIPYSATASDISNLGQFNSDDDVGGFVAIFSLISIPMDFMVDTIALPVDLVLWPFGFRKNNSF